MRFALSASPTIVSLFLAATASASVASSTMVISEFRTRGANGKNDEFIELHNRSASPVSIDGWKVLSSPGFPSYGLPSQLIQIPANTTVVSGGFFLLTNVGTYGYSGKVAPDATYTNGIDDDGGIALLDGSNTIVDQVGMSASTAYFETTPLAPMTANRPQSYERNDGGCFPDHDTDNNLQDFRFNGSTSFAKDSASNCTLCVDVICQLPLNIQCWNPAGQCQQGACQYTQFDPGTPCDDGSVCTQGEACNESGQCISGSPITCNTPQVSFCAGANTLVTHSAGTCDNVLGCQYAPVPQNCPYGCNSSTLSCNPYPCGTDTCSTPPTNGCYTASPGVCQSDGSCSYTRNSAGTFCDDGNSCTAGDTCDASGNCVGGTAVVTDDKNPCTVDTCDPATGIVTNTPKTIGSNCDDGNLCNGIETCQMVSAEIGCVSGTPVLCVTPSAGGCYATPGACEPATGICTYPFLDQGTTCDDGNPCTDLDQCNGIGKCLGSTKPCADYHVCADTSTSSYYWSGSCNATDGICSFSHADTLCALGCDSMTGLCNADPCAGVNCDSPPDSCHVGTCVNGKCSYQQLKPAGSSCDDGNSCTSGDQCSNAGACQGVTMDCNSPAIQHKCVDSATSRSWDVSGTCLPVSGLCSYNQQPDVACAYGCDSVTGLCAADPCIGMSCEQPPDQCHQSTGMCQGGTCSYALKRANSSCDDSNICTGNDVCDDNGICKGTPNVCGNPPDPVCGSNNSSSRTYGPLGTCNYSGHCDYTPTDTPCSAGCSGTSGLCTEDPCKNVVCNQPPGDCFADQGQCNSSGICVYPPKPSTVTCNDANNCTVQDACNGQGTCVGAPLANCGSGGSSGTGGAGAAGGVVATGGDVTNGGFVATGGVKATGGVTVATGGVAAATGGAVATGGVISTAGAATTGGAINVGGATGDGSPGGYAATGGTTITLTVAGGSATGGTNTVLTGGATGTTHSGGSSPGATGSNTGGSSNSATAQETTPPDAGIDSNGSSSVTSGGCNCSVPESTSHKGWVMALLALLTLRRRRRD